MKSMSSAHRLGSLSPLSSILALVLFALVLRVVFLVLAGIHAPLTGDELAYQQIAENFAAGRGFYQTNNPFFPDRTLYAWQAPLYPLALGILYKLVGVHVLLAKLFGVIVSAATVYVVYSLALRVFAGHPLAQRIAFLAAFLTAIYPGFLTNAHLLLSETLFILFMLLAFVFVAMAFEAKNPRTGLWLVGAGAAWGMTALTRGITLYFTPFFAVWVAWTLWRIFKRTPKSVVSIPAPVRALSMASLFIVGTVAVIAPWTLRNYLLFHQVVLLETKGGVNLWLGNSPYTPNDFIRNVWKVGVREPILQALPADELQRDRTAYTLALNYIRAEPATFLARVPIKFADFWGFERNLVDIADATTRGGGWNSAAKIGSDILAMVVYIFVILCGVAGFVFAPNRDSIPGSIPWNLLIVGFAAYYLFAHLVIFGDGRFHLPLVPFFTLYAAWMLVSWRQGVFATSRLGAATIAVLLFCAVWAREMWFALQVLKNG